jgi:cobalt/nickel transport system ATP-binding protein
MCVEGLRFAHPGSADLFAGLEFAVHRGERVGLVGANGSGKTTLLHLMMGLLKPTAGRILVMGREARTERDFRFVRRTLGLLFQDSDDQLFCPTVGEDVAFGPMNLGASRAEAEETTARTLAMLGLDGYADRVGHDLSGGEKRRAALASVLAMAPEALLLDEPDAGLDPRATRELVALLGRIGGTQVICSHSMEFIRSTCRRVVVLDSGRVCGDGRTDAILGDADLMFHSGLEVPYSIESPHGAHDHRHGAGAGHGHGHRQRHDTREHTAVMSDE